MVGAIGVDVLVELMICLENRRHLPYSSGGDVHFSRDYRHRQADRTGGMLMRQGPLAGRYPAAAAMVIFALVPYLGLSAALQPLTPIIGRQLHMTAQTMSLGFGMANAGYAVGTVLAVP